MKALMLIYLISISFSSELLTSCSAVGKIPDSVLIEDCIQVEFCLKGVRIRNPILNRGKKQVC